MGLAPSHPNPNHYPNANANQVPEFVYDLNMSYFDMLVPTVNTVRCSFLLERSLHVGKPMLFTGHSGVGKSVVVADTVRKMVDGGDWASLPVSFSAQTSALRTQERWGDNREM